MNIPSSRLRRRLRAAAALAGLWLAPAAVALAGEDAGGVPEPPAVVDAGDASTDAPPGNRGASTEARTIEKYGQTITEYERGGRVFLITVEPRVGPTQYWNDPDGDGQFQRRNSDDIDENVNLPKWRIGGW